MLCEDSMSRDGGSGGGKVMPMGRIVDGVGGLQWVEGRRLQLMVGGGGGGRQGLQSSAATATD